MYEGKFNGITCAVKQVRYLSDKLKIDLEVEYRRLKNLQHPNIIKNYCFFKEKEAIFMELCGLSDNMEIRDIHQWAKTKEIDTTNPISKLDAMIQINEGLKYLHDNNLTHNDLKPSNILLQGTLNNPIVKITDFGTAYYDVYKTASCHPK